MITPKGGDQRKEIDDKDEVINLVNRVDELITLFVNYFITPLGVDPQT